MTPFKRDIGAYSTPKPLHKYGAVQLSVGYDFVENMGVSRNHGNAEHCVSTDTGAAFNQTDVDKCKIQRYRVAASYWLNPKLRFTGQVSKTIADLGSAGEDDPVTVVLRAQWMF